MRHGFSSRSQGHRYAGWLDWCREGFWATPGGSLEGGEDHATAILRELGEELGIDETAIELGVHLANRSADHLAGGREVRQVERYFLARVSPADVIPAYATQPDNIREYRWWTET
ncbi:MULTISPECIES: NUDIX domain-containing protein [Streptomyces]|uniref:NUDIX domain-containing protein n=2 Tax=Streptomyces TaxID=1883 RepID=A0ABV9J8C2_9ACTN